MKTRRFFIILLINIFCLSSYAQSPVSLIIKVEGGKVEGYREEDVTIFKGVPFAAPPIGNLRWKAPQPVKSWDGVLKADKFAPACPQMSFSYPGAPKQEFSEDCLYLNVWTSAKSTDEKLPVMVWIYGGGFAMGSTSTPTYSGEQLAKMGVVLVSVAYRIGPLGFLAHPELSAESENSVSGNYGLLDQIAGLKWVQKNIESFGGDPGKVTIFGESAGGISVSMLCASPVAKGLFNGAISESGGNFGPVQMETRQDGIQHLKGAEKIGIEFAKSMGAESIFELRKIDPEKWANDPLSQMGGFWPVVDGYVIVDDQYKLYNAGKYNDVNVIIGTNSDEGAMFVRPSEPDEYKKGIEERFGDYAAKILKAYPGETKEQTFTSAADIFRETAFAWPSYAWANLQTETGKSKVFVYYFDQQQPASPMSPVKTRGAGHGSEISYVFKHLDKSQFGEDDVKLSEQMATYWTNFAKYGDPNGKDLPKWPVYNKKKSTVMYLNNSPKTDLVPNIDKLELMEEYFKYRRNLE